MAELLLLLCTHSRGSQSAYVEDVPGVPVLLGVVVAGMGDTDALAVELGSEVGLGTGM